MHLFLAMVLALFISGCSSLKVQTDYDQNTDLTPPKNFAIVHKALEGEDTLTTGRIIAAIKNELTEKGYVETTKESADFYVLFHTGVTSKTRIDTDYQYVNMYPYYYGYRTAIIPQTRVYTYEEAKLIVDAVVPRENKIVWRGTAVDYLKEIKTPQKKTAYINKVLKELMQSFLNSEQFKRFSATAFYTPPYRRGKQEHKMSGWLYRFLHHSTSSKPIRHQFGRSINAQISPQERTLFNQAMEAFREGRITEAYEHYLRSLENFNAAESNRNILFHYEEETLRFELYQGTAVINGTVTDRTFEAHATITSRELMNVAIKRHLLERNDQLTYVRYYTHGQLLKLKLYLDNTTMTPQKIFYPLRELALNADYEKEYIHYHFKQEKLIEVEHLRSIDAEELQIKYDAMQRWITGSQIELKALPANDNNSTVSFTLLSLLLQIDYLLVPQKDISQEIIEKISSYFTEDERLVEQKNDELRTFVEKLQKLDFDNFAANFYQARYTFSPMESATIEELNLFIETSLEKSRWFRQHRYVHVVSTIYRYIALYILYNYDLHPSYSALLHLLVEVNNSAFFVSLGYTPLYHEESGRFDKEAIAAAVNEAIEPYQKEFVNLEPFGKQLNYTTLEEFSHSFYQHLKNLNYTEL